VGIGQRQRLGMGITAQLEDHVVLVEPGKSLASDVVARHPEHLPGSGVVALAQLRHDFPEDRGPLEAAAAVRHRHDA
jgi:hypothetical protein